MTGEYTEYRSRGYRASAMVDFPRLWKEAVCYIEKVTYGRACNAENSADIEAVADCAYAITDCLAKFETAQNMTGVASENVDGYSVTYTDAAQVSQMSATEILRICSLYLPADMLYRGI